jgi:putative sterol carrier protein
MGSEMDGVLAEQEALLRAEPHRTQGLDMTFEFELFGDGGGTWHLAIADGEPAIRRGPAPRWDLRVIVSVEDYLAMKEGEVAGRDLFFSGRMHLEGNALLGMVLGRVLGRGEETVSTRSEQLP